MQVKKKIRVHLESGKIHKIDCGYSKRIKAGNYEDFFTVAEAEHVLRSKGIIPEKCWSCFNSAKEE